MVGLTDNLPKSELNVDPDMPVPPAPGSRRRAPREALSGPAAPGRVRASRAADETNERIMSLTRDEWDAKDLLEESIKVQLRMALASGDPTGEAASELARMHER